MIVGLTVFFALLGPFIALAAIRRPAFDNKAEWKKALLSKGRLNLVLYVAFPVLYATLYIFKSAAMEPIACLHAYLVVLFCIIAAGTDSIYKIIPNRLVLAMLAVWIVTMVPFLVLAPATTVPYGLASLLGMLLGGGIFLLVYAISKKGLGGGDVKLAGAMGLYLTIGRILPTILYGTVAAAVWGLVLIALKRINRKDSLPLAPFLLVGLLITLYLL